MSYTGVDRVGQMVADALNQQAALLYESDEEEFKRRFIGELGSAPHTEWEAEDGWIVGYTTGRLYGGKHEGKFAAFAYRPVGKGARSGRGAAYRHTLVYWRTYSKRKAAKARAVALYYRHSPKIAARHGRQV